MPHLRGPARAFPQAVQEEAREHKTHSSGWHLGSQLPGTVSVWPRGNAEAKRHQAPLSATLGELTALRFGSSGSIWPAPEQQFGKCAQEFGILTWSKSVECSFGTRDL